MTVLTENLQTLTGVNWRRAVRFYVPLIEGGFAAAGAIATAVVNVIPDDTGVITTPEFLPGRAQVRIDGHSYDFDIPDSATPVDLAPLLGLSIDYPPPVVQEAQEHAISAAASAASAAASAAAAGGGGGGGSVASVSVKSPPYNAVGDDATNDRAAIASADTAGQAAGLNLLFPKGIYRVASNLTITSPVVMQPGAIIKPASGVTVTLNGGVIATPQKIFDHSLGGLVVPKNVDFYQPQWWGPTGTANDSAAWTAMAAALQASAAILLGTNFGQRVLSPPGINRIIGITLANCEIFAGRGVSIFVPPNGTTTGTILTLGDYTQLNGGFFATTETAQAVICLKLLGYRAQADDVYIANQSANSVGCQLGSTSSGSTSPVVNNIRICSGLTTPAAGSIGLDVQSSDLMASNVWVAQFNMGITTQRGDGRWSNVHVWGCNTGIGGENWDATQMTNLYLDSNRGWGMDIDKMDYSYFNGIYAWNNGYAIGSTGGIRLQQTVGGAARSKFLNVFLDDNVGTGLYVDGTVDAEATVSLLSSSLKGGGALVTTTGVLLTVNATRLQLRLRGTGATTPITDSSTSTIYDDPSQMSFVYNNAATLTMVAGVDVYVGYRTSASSWTLPPKAPAGQRVVIKNSGTGIITVTSANPATDFIYDTDGGVALSGGTFTVQPYGEDVDLFSDGSEWQVVSGKSGVGGVNTQRFVTLTSAYTLTSQTAAQKLFNASTNGAVTLSVGTYFFECYFSLSSMSGTSGSFGWDLVAGTATIAGINWSSMANKAVLATAATPQSTANTAANVAIATATTATVGWARITGKVRISAVGTVIPSVSLGVAAAAVVGADSYFRIWSAGPATITTFGTWS